MRATLDHVDASTPTVKIVFTVLGAIAELERSFVAGRVRAGIRNARAKCKGLGRPRVAVDASRIAVLRARRHSWDTIRRETGIARGTAQRAFYSLPQIPAPLNWVLR